MAYIPRLTTPSEAEEQIAVMKWASMQENVFPCLKHLFHIPNGGGRNIAEAANLKRMGVKAGVPDLFLPYPAGDWHGLWIELKTERGRVMGAQREWVEYLQSQGYAAYVCRGAEQAINCLKEYLKGNTKEEQKQGKKADIILRGEP